MIWRLVIFQEGGGCDYTIGCGVRMVEFKVPENTTWDQLMELAKKELEDFGMLPSREELKAERVILFQGGHDLPYAEWDAEAHEEIAAGRERVKREEELALLAKLKAKYGEL